MTPQRNEEQDPYSLYTPKNRGGTTGGGGYNFQDSFITLKIPEWLSIPEYKSYIKEGIEDATVNFEGSSSSWVWLYQMKNYPLDISGLKEILSNFKEKKDHPGLNVQKMTIGCCGTNEDVKSLWQMIREYRGLYNGLTEQQLEPTKKELSKKIQEHGLSEYEDMLIQFLEIEYGFQGVRESDLSAMQNSFFGAFARTKFYSHEEASVIDRVFVSLSFIINKKIRQSINREELETIIRSELVTAKKGNATVVYLHGWIKQEYEDPANEILDMTPYFDRDSLSTPKPEIWENNILSSLYEIRKKYDSDRKKRNIWLRSKAPLSLGLAFGYVFAETLGYNIQIEQPSGGLLQYWQTDTPDAQDVALMNDVAVINPEGDDLVVAIGATDDPKPKVEEFLKKANLNIKAALYLYPQSGPSDTSINEQTAVGFARATKKEIRSNISKFSPKIIHLFYFGPLGLAVLLGQKMNGLIDIQCYERSKDQLYVPSCLISA